MNNNQQKLLDKIFKLMTFQEKEQKNVFILGQGTDKNKDTKDTTDEDKNRKNKNKRRKEPKKPQRIKKETEKDKNNEGIICYKKLRVEPSLEVNKTFIQEIYSLPKNKDIIIREFTVAFHPSIKAMAVFIDGLADKVIINNSVLKPLMLYPVTEEGIADNEIAEYIKNHILPSNDVKCLDNYQDIIESINYGSTVIFLHKSVYALAVETKGWDRRPVGKPETEQVIIGPHEAFNETLRSNTALIRKGMRNEKLITEMFKLGERNKTDAAIMYIEDLANPDLVDEVKKRLASIKTDYLGGSGVLEQFIEDHPFMPSPQVLSTERPDRVASFLVEGKVAIIVDGNPNVLIVPTTLFSLLHSAEDYYLRLPYANFVRYIRIFAIFISIITPGAYIGISTFHQEMLPTELLLALAAARVTVPFPTGLEVIMMELSFELIREAGVRVPGVIGNTIGIVGALILGQAAVQAGIVSPILVIVIAVTGLASFTIPNYSMSFAFRGVRFIFTILAAFFGFFGLSAALFLLLTSMAGMKSFGVPFLAPIGPKTKTDPDLVIRGPVWSMERRPDYMNTLDRQRQPKISRQWIKPSLEEEENE